MYQHIFKVSGAISKNRILMVGDTFETDILGAQNSGIDSALVLTGNTHKYHSIYESLDDKVSVLGKKAKEFKIFPTFITELT
jgi:ribonucleotide monophosphatase NagD (HAD superfamily)